ncbi:MAG: hypothetical protein R3279_13460 [Putridiphycobacter sp.]|nr:hypothetical protein [Putridiphycobacter sp.]
MDEIKLNVNGIELAVSKDQLSESIESGELKIESENLVIKSKEDHEQFMDNIAKEKKTSYDDGAEVGEKRAVNKALEAYGLQMEEKKTVENFSKLFKQHIVDDAKIEPSKKIEELQSDNEKLRTNYSELETQFSTFKTDVQKKETEAKINSVIMNAVPKEGTLISADEIGLIFKSRHNIEVDDNNNVIVKKDGEILKNETTRNPMSVADVMNDFITPYVKKPDGGKSEGDKGSGNKAGSYESFVQEMEQAGNAEGSMIFSKEMNKRIKDGTLRI